MWKQSNNQSRYPQQLPRSTRHKHAPPSSRPHYDIESGQVYTETQARVSSRHQSDWIGEFRTPSLVKPTLPNSDGARKLGDTAQTATIKQLRSLSSEHLATVPWAVAKTLWEEIIARWDIHILKQTSRLTTNSHRESFHAWRIFASTYESEFQNSSYRYYLRIRQPPLPLEDYVHGIDSTDLSWLTCLRISPKETRVADLVSLHQLSNLGVLDLSDGQITIDTKVSSFDERVMRTWAELAEAKKSFQYLQVLLLGWQEHVSMWLLKYLNSFPSLRQVVLTDCPNIHQKNRRNWEAGFLECGWEARRAKKSAKSLRPVFNEPGFHVGAVSGLLYLETNTPSSEYEKDDSSRAGKPVLECWLGTPKTWTHILDDFPGTRTIFFDRVQMSSEVAPVAKDDLDSVKRARDRHQQGRWPPSKRAWKPGIRHHAGLDLLAELGNP